jgi:hypothetical protein
MKRSILTYFFVSIALIAGSQSTLFAQSASLELVYLGGDMDSVRIILRMENNGSGNFVMEAVYVTLSYESAKLYCKPKVGNNPGSIYAHRFASSGWGMDSDPLFRAFQPADGTDTIQYGESTPTVGSGITIPKNAPLDLCNMTFFPKVHPECSLFALIGNSPTAAYTGFYITTQVNSIPFMPASNQTLCWTPVEYLTFNAEQQGATIAVRWTTASETNNYGFFVERRYAEQQGAEWKQMAFYQGRGTTSSEISYLHVDNALEGPGTYEYRLLQQDFDGKKEYSPVRKVEYVLNAPSFALYQNYPNPVSSSSPQGTVLKYSLVERSQVRLVIMNTLGQVVAELVNNSFPIGTYSPTWMPLNMTPGMYIATLTAQGLESGAVQSASVRIQVVN